MLNTVVDHCRLGRKIDITSTAITNNIKRQITLSGKFIDVNNYIKFYILYFRSNFVLQVFNVWRKTSVLFLFTIINY